MATAYLINGNKVVVFACLLIKISPQATVGQTTRSTTVVHYITFFGWLFICEQDADINFNGRKDFAWSSAKLRFEEATSPASRNYLIRIDPFKELWVNSLLEKVQ